MVKAMVMLKSHAESTGRLTRRKRSMTARQGRTRKHERLAAYLFVAPDALGLAVFVMLPLLVALAASLFSINAFGRYKFVALQNFQTLASDSLFWHSMKITALYSLISTPLTFVVSLGIAMLMRKPFPGAKLVRMALFAPYVLSLVVVAIIWQFMLVDKRGLVPTLLRPFGLGNVSLLGNPSLVLMSYIVITLWFLVGYQMILFMAGLSNIPSEYEDAANIDGAGVWQRFRFIVWPLLRPTSFFVGVTSVIGAVMGAQAFDLVYVLTGGGPAYASTTILLYIYQRAFTYGDFGYAAAMTVLVVAILGVITAIWFGFTRGGKFEQD